MEYRGKFCVVCGRRIPELSMRKKTCSDFCNRRKKCGYAPYIDCPKLPYDDLTTLQQEAHKRGMSYGKYMASLSSKPDNRKGGESVCH